jgi:Fe(3+) dicitrate transport protein
MKKSFTIYLSIFLILIFNIRSSAQDNYGTVKGTVKDNEGKPLAHAAVILKNTKYGAEADEQGQFVIKNVPPGSYTIEASYLGYRTIVKEIIVTNDQTTQIDFETSEQVQEVEAVEIRDFKSINGIGYLPEEKGAVIYSGKKTEVLLVDSLNANTAQNNPRQILGRIPGMNFSETEGAGFPSNGVGLRGLNPTQSIEMNTRQNGYNITSDIYGYNESYYVPAMDGVKRIEVTRGAASLQFGPQFGGVINYIMKDGSREKPFEYTTQQTGGSFGLFASSHSIGGTYKKLNYYAFVQYKSVDGWRPNSGVKQVSGFGKIEYQATSKLKLGLEYSILRNRIQMPGGLTDSAFSMNSKQSVRGRNWLNSPWNILTATLDYKVSENTLFTIKAAGLSSGRNLVWRNEDGGPGAPDTIDRNTGTYVSREVEKEKFNSLTTEARLRINYKAFGMSNTFATGIRFFTGKMHRLEGGPGSTGVDFDLNLYGGNYEKDLRFTTNNFSYFFENTFRISERFSVTPGFRYEFIKSTEKGYTVAEDVDSTISTGSSKIRSIPLFGIGSQYKITSSTNLYANISQAYRPIDYSALTPFGVISKIDPHMKDSYGYNADFGWRGTVKNFLNFDIGGFYLAYNRRIGLITQTDALGNPFTLRTNVANSVNKGIETYVEINPVKMLTKNSKIGSIGFFNSFAYINAKYVSGEFKGKWVEYAPNYINRFGITYSFKNFSATYQLSNTGKSYGDANNTISSHNAVIGIVPAYKVMDLSVSYKIKNYNIKGGINNLADARYFTKRTDEYPGPGIIPSIGRSFYISFGAKF